MKAILILLTFTAFVSAIPVDPVKFDWTKTMKDFQEIKAILTDTLTSIVVEALKSNIEVGARLGFYLTAQRADFMRKTHANIMEKEITERTLTHDKAKVHFVHLKTAVGDLRQKIDEMLIKLPAPTAEIIHHKIKSATAQIEVLGRKILAGFQVPDSHE